MANYINAAYHPLRMIINRMLYMKKRNIDLAKNIKYKKILDYKDSCFISLLGGQPA